MSYHFINLIISRGFMFMKQVLSRVFLVSLMLALGMPQSAVANGRYKDQGMQQADDKARRERKRNRGSKGHPHRWKGHKARKGEQGDWKGKWHGGRGFNKHASHMWNKYGWFWNDEQKVWFQCEPVNDPARGYGCELDGKWYPMVKEGERKVRGEGRMGRGMGRTAAAVMPESTVTVEEVVDGPDEDVVGLEEDADGDDVNTDFDEAAAQRSRSLMPYKG